MNEDSKVIRLDMDRPLRSLLESTIEAIIADDMPQIVSFQAYREDGSEVAPIFDDSIGRALKVMAGYLLMSSIDGKYVKDFVLKDTGNKGINDFTTSL